jgi:subtilisin family serine protease
MLSIARFKALSALRRRPEEGLNEETAERIEDQSDDPEVALAKKDKGAVLRQVIDLVYYHEKSAAEVSGIVALMLQREPTLNPDNVRHILLTTAKDLGPGGRDNSFGADLADAYRAIVAEKSPVARMRPLDRARTGAR